MKTRRKSFFYMGVLIALASAFILSACIASPPPDVDPEPEDKGSSLPVISVVINQIYGRGFEGVGLGDTAGSHSFVELYNTGTAEADLTGYALHAGANGIDENGNPWTAWNSALALSGKIPAKHSFLVAVTANTVPSETANLTIAADGYDLAWPMSAFTDADRVGLCNKNLKICLTRGTGALAVKNPFDADGAGKKVDGYVDMLSVSGNDSTVLVDAYEGGGAAAGQSKQKAVRRVWLADTDESASDVRIVDYRSREQNSGGVSDIELALYRPRSLKDGAWYGAEPAEQPSAQGLIINQIMGIGTKNNDGQSASHSFVELYNGSDEAIDLSGYTVQAAANGTAWMSLALSGTVLPKHFFLIVLTKTGNAEARLVLTEWDLAWEDVSFPNKGLKVVLLNADALLAVENPFDTDGSGTRAPGYVDMIGVAGNDPDSTIDGFEGAYWAEQSKQKSVRRKNFADTDDNREDTEVVDFRTAELDVYRPRSLSDGAWNG
ncbi:MAG: lamin tail domain-containing protein [Clostridiales bacterium]|jgi:hypothetical protein|nr:lamin tail domain-containing protein [Clostridiales bacterium]